MTGYRILPGRNVLKTIFKELIASAKEADEIALALPMTGDESESAVKSPFVEFRQRQRGYLTVTDLIAPAWCEVQFDYGLRQFRNKPISKRPQSFVTPKGKEIKVEAKVAAKNEDILDKGKIVHKKLEREIHKEEVLIKVKRKEEIWALKLLDFLVRLKTIKATSVVRELPIWGIIQDHPVYGKIDELRLETSNLTNGPNNLTSQSKDGQTQTKLHSFLTNAKEIIHASFNAHSQIIHIIDNKTRQNASVPSHVDSLPSRLQLMLYWLMLTRALTTSDDGTSFSSFCARIGLRPARKFSGAFITEMASLIVENELSLHFLDAKCLEDMDFPYRETIKQLGLEVEGCVSKRLSVVYRLRRSSAKKPKSSSAMPGKTKKSTKSQDHEKNAVIVKAVAEESTLVVDEESIKLAPPMDGAVDTAEDKTLDAPCPKEVEEASIKRTSEMTGVDDGGDGNTSTRKRKRNGSHVSSAAMKTNSTQTTEVPIDTSTGENESSSQSDDDSPKRPSAFIIGTKKFQYDEGLLSAHLSSVLAWWHGKRPPNGVSIEDVGRCNSCEYKNGCEWREQKALETLEKAKAKSVATKTGL
ncbi:hypothetical protein A7U60_g5805 [Sanghuangporus baumii]|uniref:Exonuclease V n=1 Tax=Sanghuangporus baumii TaxID=108892 RepID=A0A9Q5HW27_SANBA|nr:hypothetical protein A7U60_g5805 [Sanghuangporus baumii]